MKSYQHHIGDFDRATRHLTRIERSVYRDLMDLYYDTEEQLTLDKAAICRKILARSNEEVTAVEQVLNEFFTETTTGWFHSRCEEEIERYRSNNSQKAMAGKASAEARARKRQLALNGNSTGVATGVEQTNNGTPTNQKPETRNHGLNTSGDDEEDPDDSSNAPEEPDETDDDGKAPKKPRAGFDYETGRFTNLSEELYATWITAYPAIDVRTEINKARAWLIANPKNRKKAIERFLNNWLSRAQDRAPRVGLGGVGSGQAGGAGTKRDEVRNATYEYDEARNF